MMYLRNTIQWALILFGSVTMACCGPRERTGECLTAEPPGRAYIHDSLSLIDSARLFKSARINPDWREEQVHIQPDKDFIFAETTNCLSNTNDYLLLIKLKNNNSIALVGPPRTAALAASIPPTFDIKFGIYGINYFKDDYDAIPNSAVHRYVYNYSDYYNGQNINYRTVEIDLTGNNKEDIKISICPYDSSGNSPIQGC